VTAAPGSDGQEPGRLADDPLGRMFGFVPEPEGGVMSEVLRDRAGRRRSPATLPEFHAGRAPGSKDLRYPADPPEVEEIDRDPVALVRCGKGRRRREVGMDGWAGSNCNPRPAA
jgi:hypothetical protein